MLARRLIIFQLLIFVLGSRLSAQSPQYSFSRIDMLNGLSSNQANCFYKDRQGFLWTGTMVGLNRYDGYQFKNFTHSLYDTNTLSNDFINRILEGPDDKLWIETKTGFNLFDPATEKFTRNVQSALYALGLPLTNLTDIQKDRKGNFWFLSGRQTLNKYDPVSRKTTSQFKSLFQQQAIASFAFNTAGECIILQTSGLITIIDPSSGKILRTDRTPAQFFGERPLYYSIFVDAEGDWWIYSAQANKGVLRINPTNNTFRIYSKNSGQPNLNTNLVVSMQQDRQGKIWICTDHGGINLLDKKTNTIQYLLHSDDEPKSLSQNSITASYMDDTGVIWLGTYKQGISYYHENTVKFPAYRKKPTDPGSLPFNDVNRFVEDRKGNLWIGTNGGGLVYFNRQADKFYTYKHDPNNINSVCNDVIVSLLLDRDDKLWIGTYYGGLDCYSNGKFIHYKADASNHNSLSDNSIWEIYEDKRSNLWIGTLGAGLNRFDRQQNIFYHLDSSQVNGLNSNYVAALAEDQHGNLWIATDNGIDVLDPNNNVTHYGASQSKPGSLTHNYIICFYLDTRNRMWIGTRDGLHVFHEKTRSFQSFRTVDGLPGNAILNILEDQAGQLWLSTNSGIAKVTVRGSDNSLRIQSVNYDELDGLQGTEFNENAALLTSKHELIFGGANGFNIFQPSNIHSDRQPSKVIVTDLQLFNKSVAIGENIHGRPLLERSISQTDAIRLKHDENILSLEFAALNFSNPEKIKYAYKLDGFNDDWVYTDGRFRKAIYTNLDPGDYTFRVKASDEDGGWTGSETKLTIHINPPFWKTPLAYLLYAAIIVFALWIARRIVLDRAHMRFEVEQQRKEAERVQQLDALKTKFFTNVSHEFRTPLSLILSPLDKIVKKTNEPEQKKMLQLVQRNAKRLLNLVNQLLDFRKMEVQEFTLHRTKGDMVKFIQEISTSFSDISENKDISLRFTANIGALIMYFDRDKMEKILFNLLSNAFKYTPTGGSVEVTLNYIPPADAPASFELTIKDSGIGIPIEMHDKIFERFYQLDVAGDVQNSGSGIGLVITKEFVKLHDGNIRVESIPEQGTSFIVSMPVRLLEEPQFIEPTQQLIDNSKETAVMDERPSGASRPTVLLVEDNEDFRFYLKDNLQQKYFVTEATNGKDGWEKAKTLQPDLIVSDIMMPMMNGIDLARKIKTDPRTSHIPVILLTAMSNEESELEGFRAGVNDYISKPFSFEILGSRIRNMLAFREQLRKKFQQQIEISAAEVTVSPVDEEFMTNAFALVEKNMDNPEFSVEDLSRGLFMSRVSFYKKLLALTGKTPIEFIRIMRLKRAAQFLQKSNKTIAEVAYEVGFNNPKLFAKYFKEEFGKTPSQFQGEKKES